MLVYVLSALISHRMVAIVFLWFSCGSYISRFII